MFGLHLYDGFLKVVPVDSQGRINNQGKEAFRIRVEEREVGRRRRPQSTPSRVCIPQRRRRTHRVTAKSSACAGFGAAHRRFWTSSSSTARSAQRSRCFTRRACTPWH